MAYIDIKPEALARACDALARQNEMLEYQCDSAIDRENAAHKNACDIGERADLYLSALVRIARVTDDECPDHVEIREALLDAGVL